MGSQPETHYAKSGDVHLAYQAVGDGPIDLVIVRGYISHVESAWESPALAGFYRRLTSFCRLILFDKRGTGLSDRVPEHQLPTLEQRMDDLRAVMDAAGSRRAALFGSSEGAPLCLLFAATFPQRTAGLILWGAFAKYDWRRSFIGRYWGGDTVDEALDRLEREWGDGGDIVSMAPSLADDEGARAAWGRAQRLGATPGAARAILRMMLDVDVRPILSSIRVPTLVLQRADDVAVDASHARYIAGRVPGARYVELSGKDHLFWAGDVKPVVAEIAQFLTGAPPPVEADRVVATVLFVEQCDGAAAEPDRFSDVVRTQVAGFEGRPLAQSSAALAATFDGPGRAIRCAEAIRSQAAALAAMTRAGVHTGECQVDSGAVRGVAVDLARDILERAAPGDILVSRTVVDLVAGSGLPFSARGSHRLSAAAGLWHLLAVGQDDAQSNGRTASLESVDPAAAVFRREGQYWTVAYGGRTVRVRDTKGMRYLARLLLRPHTEFHVLDLLAGDGDASDAAAREDGLQVMRDDAGPILDDTAKVAYRARISDLREQIAEAERWRDTGRAAHAQDELDAVVRQLAGAVGLGGRDRRAASASERARFSVSKALRTAVRRLEEEHPELGRHLALTVRSGTFCAYEPDPRATISWDR